MGTLWKLTGLVVVLAIAVLAIPLLARQEVVQAAQPSDELTAELKAVREARIAAFKARDVDAVMKTFSTSPDTVFMGTGPGELWVGPEEIRQAHEEIFKAYDDETAETTWATVNVNGDVAWVMATLDVNNKAGEKEKSFQINQSIVAEKQDGKWVIVALHYSNLTGGE
jgi:uncharacterized protein (TIGR02246 family)